MACHAETFDTFAPNAVRRISTAEAATTAAVWVIELLGVVFAFGARFTGYFRISHTTHLLQNNRRINENALIYIISQIRLFV